MDLLRSLPIGLYLEKPTTWLHHIDPRVKLFWLLSFLFAPVLATLEWRIGLVLILVALTISARIPWRVWKQQMGWLLAIGFFAFIITAITPDGLGIDYQQRLPASGLELPQPTSYQYVVYKAGKVLVTRRSLDLAIRLSTILFILIYSSSLFLLTTAPEEITAALEYFMQPLKRFKVPVTEIILTLTLSLRFIPLVLEEIQNLARSINTRAIEWKKLGLRKSLSVWLIVADRLLENLLARAEQIAVAMDVRGFTSPNRHRVQWHILRFRAVDWLAIAVLVGFWSARLLWGGVE
ncbi:CbiQ family ECF transporter T component [Oscillatoria sp. FACHB-1406]|uniref:energy-coupling factor transporter transmembrane component T family protein n=1 Tax=Oscillatoria sp. FACHB-1406 TaxID=2692846 RepID=UPI00168292CD|nr:CbiQ family ECF transporter T component [Oscillatoria sp. FACHB-1406]MBD2578396.1 CbiQ family ECF transporter T component [Oscillatoria sp. FACHB-1406]